MATELWNAPAVVLDCGTGYSKLGFAGNLQPSLVLPTALALDDSVSKPNAKLGPLEDLHYSIGQEALDKALTHNIHYPVKQGVVDNWDFMERFWQQAFFRYMRLDPSEQPVIVTEPPLNAPENRELTAEILFETFNVAGLYIGTQATLALYASFIAERTAKAGKQALTGCVVDSGHGVTHVIPVVDGFVIGSCIRTIPLAGRDITLYVQQALRERGERVPAHTSLDAARGIKESLCYIASDKDKEGPRRRGDPNAVKAYTGTDPRTGAAFTSSVGDEAFLGPELLFSPQAFTSEWTASLPQVVDDVIQSCPIDARRPLYGNVVLSGGSTLFKGFAKRLQRDVKRLVDARLGPGATLEVHVRMHHMQKHAAWLGGSLLGAMPSFETMYHSRAAYEEHGPSICRSNAVFSDV